MEEHVCGVNGVDLGILQDTLQDIDLASLVIVQWGLGPGCL